MTYVLSDDKRIADALRFYCERVTWRDGDSERGEYERLREAFAVRARDEAAPRREFVAATGNLRVENLKRRPGWVLGDLLVDTIHGSWDKP